MRNVYKYIYIHVGVEFQVQITRLAYIGRYLDTPCALTDIAPPEESRSFSRDRGPGRTVLTSM